MSTAGPNNPATASGSGWGTPTGIESNSTFATYSIPASTDENTGALLGSNFGFTIPSTATIQGISVTIAEKTTAGLTADVYQIQLRKAGTNVGTFKSGANWPLTVADETFGSGSDLWGTTWTYSDINNSGFGVSVIVEGNNGTGVAKTLSTQNFRITVTYTTSTGAVTTQRILIGF